MGKAQSNTVVLDKYDGLEIALEILSFAGGENTISEDQATKTQEARQCENWRAISLGGMEREVGFSKVGDGGATYTEDIDLIAQHKDSGGTATYGIIEGDLVIKSGANLNTEDNGAFTSGVLSHAVSDENGKLWITNSTDNLKMKAVGVAIATPSSVPPSACDRIYIHKNRMVAEGSVTYPYRVYGTRSGKGNWTASDAWSLANDAWSIDVPDATRGCVPNFPSGNETLVFTERNAYALSNFPSTSYRPIGTPARGCCAPYSIALGDEGVYFLSRYPTLGVFLFDGTSFNELTEFNRDVFVDLIDLTKRVFGVYRNRRYYIIYNEKNSGDAFPNRMRIYDARFGRWMDRPIAEGLSDNFGYPALLKYSANELYLGSSQVDKVYSYDDTTTSDAGEETVCEYRTKDFSSRDMALASGGSFPIDDVKMKLTKLYITYYGTVGSIGVQFTLDRGLHSATKTVSLVADGDKLNTTFEVNTSYIVQLPPDRTVVYTLPNGAVCRRFQIQLNHSGSSTPPKIKKIKIEGIAIDEA